MVFENIGMRNPGFLLEDARHGYIQYISLSECYFAGKGAALVLPPNERARPSRRVSAAGCDIQQHLQSMFYLLRPEETLKMAVKLESVHPGRTRYLVVVSCTGRQDAEESCLLGIDCNVRATVGLVLRVLADTAITLDGDGGFSVSVCGRQHIFKPVSVQAMWSALQTLHKVSSKAREQNYFLGGLSHDWVSYYEQRIESDRSCLNEWHAMDNLESRRPPSPDSVRNKPREREETERVIRSTLKEIMMSVDLDEVTSKYIRGRLEEDLDMDLGEFKPFIDQEMLTILGQMDAPTEIFDHVYLGSEWNASNLEELQKNGVRHILNVTREIDNFFPGMFNYLNVRVYDDEKTDLLKHWDDTFKYITKAKKEGSKVLVHCKMGVSRSASVVIAYAMKAYNWDFSQAWKHVKDKRNCIKPNNSFLLQLETYQGILDAMKNKEKLQRSKSDTNLKSPTLAKDQTKKEQKVDSINGSLTESSGVELKSKGQRPKSWSPNLEAAENIIPAAPLSQSLESIDKTGNPEVTREDLLRGSNPKTGVDQEARNVLMPCDNGQSYSVSQNQIVHLPGPDAPSVKHRVNKLEKKRKGLVLNLTNQFEAATSKPSSPDTDGKPSPLDDSNLLNGLSAHVPQITAVVLKKEVWDPGDRDAKSVSECLVWTNGEETDCPTTISATRKSKRDPFSAQLDKVFDREEKRRNSPSRQSSWSSYDSAVVLDNSVHSSWATLPSRNSSWGSYDMRPADPLGSSGLFPYDKEEIPWHPGTVKRTKQKLEEGVTVKRVCTQNSELGFAQEEPTQVDAKPDRSFVHEESRLTEDPPIEGFNPLLLHYPRHPSPSSARRLPSPSRKAPSPSSAPRNPSPSRRVSSPNRRVSSPNRRVSSPNRRVSPPPSRSPVPGRNSPTPSKNTPVRNSPTLVRNSPVRSIHDQNPDSSPAIDISPMSLRQMGRLSTSAPAPSSLSSETDLPLSLRTCRSESETSSPSVVNTPQCPSVKHHKMVLENLSNKPIFNKRCFSVDDSPEAEYQRNISGIVKNLKKEFEAKSFTKSEKSPENCESDSCTLRQKRDVKIRSLPSSPVIAHESKIPNLDPKTRDPSLESKVLESSLVSVSCDSKDLNSPSRETEDLSVRVLVGKYEVAMPEVKRNSEIQMRVGNRDRDSMEMHPPAKSKIAPEFARRSAPVIINHSSLFTEAPEAPGRPPIPSPSVVVASVVAKAASKKQQQYGRTHPLARLQDRPRHSSPVYNTM